MNAHSPKRLPSAFTLFDRLLALPERVAGLFRRSATPTRPARLVLEAMEERLVPDGRPLPLPVIFAGAGVGQAPVVKAFDAETGALKFATTAYESSFHGGVRVAAADFTRDAIPDVVVAPGPGRGPLVRVLDGTTGEQIAGPLGSFLAYPSNVTGGVFMAAADVDGDGTPDVVTAAATEHGTLVKAFSGLTGGEVASLHLQGALYGPGVTVAAADLNEDGRAEVVVGGRRDGWVTAWELMKGTQLDGPLGSFQAFESHYPGGVFVGSDALAGDVDGDLIPDLAVGTDSGAGARVRVFSGATGELLHDLIPFGPHAPGGARVALAYVDDDPFADLVVGSGPGAAAAVRVFGGVTGQQLAAPLGEYSPFAGAGGVFVAATNDPIVPGVTFTTAPGSAVLGQVKQAVVRVTGSPSPGTPTGTVTFTAMPFPSGPTTTLATVNLVSDGSGYRADATLNFASLKAGTYMFFATYSGDANYTSQGANTTFSVSNTGSGVPANLIPVGCVVPDLIVFPAGAGGQARGGSSASGVNYATGSVTVGRTDLSSSGFGSGWGMDWSWTSASGYADGTSGGGATLSQSAHLVQANGNDSVALVSNAATAHFFDLYGGAYHARFFDTAAMTHDTGNGVFVVTDGTGRVLTFYDFSGGTPAGRAGKLKKVSDAEGNVTEVTAWATGGKPEEVQRVSGTGGSALTESFLYTYVASGTNAGLLETVTQRTKVGTGSWSTVRSTAYTYHDGTTSVGKAGELRTAVLKDASGNTIGTSYHRYYTTGSTSRLKFAFGPDAFARLTAALGSSVDSLTDAQVDDYADKYVEYDATSGKVTKVVDAAAGCSVCTGGQGQFTYTYTANSSSGLLLLPNIWANKTVETLPDGSTNTVYTNAFGQVMLTVFDDAGTSGLWHSYTRYDDAGRTILEAGPSVVTGFSESNADLVGYSGGNATYLDDDDGLVTAYTYATSTTATTSTAGDALGYLKQVDIKHGETGTAIPQQALTYIKRTAGSVDLFFVAAQTVYRNDNGTGGITTSYAYTWQGSTAQPESVTVTLPAVTTAQNGSNSATTAVMVFDEFGRPVWAKDQGGFISYAQYDTVTGAVVKAIIDVDTTQTSDFANLPSGWSTPSGGGLHLITTYEVDALGRVTKATSPEGRIDYTVYDDTAADGDPREVRYYRGWNATTDAPTGPTTVVRADPNGGYTETLTMSAAPALNGSDLPTGGEDVAKVQSLSRSYANAVGQVTHADAYFNLSGLTYSTSNSLGTEGAHFYRTEYQYDDKAQVKRAESPMGTITRTVRDGQGRVTSEWVGTDDTPTSGNWSPTNTDGTNLVKVREYEYDGGSVGDGNVTKVTEYPGGGAVARATQSWFDWRNRAVAVKQGVEASEATGVNRPLVYHDFDNLGRVTKTRMYDADTVTPTFTDDVPQPLSASLLRAQTTASFDELGRVYHGEINSVDPSDGTVDSDTLKTDTWFDARGLVVKTAAPGGLVQKVTYDGAGRATAVYLTDGGGDSGYSDADDVTGDTVLEQTETTYDDDDNAIKTVSRQRFHDASGTGALGDPSSGVGARVSYAGYYYDNANRLTASVDVGTNAGSAWTRPGSAPSGSSTVLVTSYDYTTDAVQAVTLTGNPTGGTFTLTFGGQTTAAIAYNASAAAVDSALEALSSIGTGNVAVVATPDGNGWEVRFTGTLANAYQSAITGSGAGLTGGTSPSVAVATVSYGGDAGRAAEVTDPAGRVTRTYTDALGRTVRTVENFVDGVVSDADDKTAGYTYEAAGMTSLTAYLTGGGYQTTQWLFGVTQSGGSAIDSNDILGEMRWPDPSLGSATESETTDVNALGQMLMTTGRNGNVHTLSYDVLGRVASDAVTTLGSGVDGAVRRIETAYDGQGNSYLITSYDAVSGGNVANQVQREFNGLGQLTKEWQSHSGAVNTSTSPKVQYAYSEMPSGANHSRLTSVTYPSGYVLTFNYSAGLNSDVSRLSSLSDTSGTLESYDYLGLGTVVRRAHSQPNVDLSYVKRSGESNGDAGDQYTGLDRFGRVADQRWLNPTTGTATDRFQYGYDAAGNRLYRDNLVNTAFGELYAYDALNQLASFDRGTLNGTKTGLTGSASRAQDWDYDALGNWDGVTTDGTTQTRTANRQNEYTSVSGATTPTYDANGNMTRAETGLRYVYDAWNRPVAVKDSAGTTTLKTYSYDGLHRRVTETASGTTTDLSYSSPWQVLEEKVGSDTTKRYVWSPVYVDALVLRDRDADGNTGNGLEERLWVQQDANFNVTALVNGSGTVVERYAYDPFGVATVLSASWSILVGSAYGWVILFHGGRLDSVGGLYHFRNRDYSPTLGRWVSLDPIEFEGGDSNLYGFVGNDPGGKVDPHGLSKFGDWLRRRRDDIRDGGSDLSDAAGRVYDRNKKWAGKQLRDAGRWGNRQANTVGDGVSDLSDAAGRVYDRNKRWAGKQLRSGWRWANAQIDTIWDGVSDLFEAAERMRERKRKQCGKVEPLKALETPPGYVGPSPGCFYGRYCGPPTSDQRPIDCYDQACQEHDLCLGGKLEWADSPHRLKCEQQFCQALKECILKNEPMLGGAPAMVLLMTDYACSGAGRIIPIQHLPFEWDGRLFTL